MEGTEEKNILSNETSLIYSQDKQMIFGKKSIEKIVAKPGKTQQIQNENKI